MAEEVSDSVEIENELKCADELIAQEERHFLEETNQAHFEETGALDPFHLMNYSKRFPLCATAVMSLVL